MRQLAAPGWSFGLRMAASVALMAVGLGMGYLLFGATPPPASGEYAGDPFASSDIRVQNVRFQETDPASGEVELSFYAARPVTLRGAVDDPKIQRLLAYALVNESNPGVRLQAADLFRSQAAAEPDREVRNALIAALRSDTNDGVRTKAIQALAEYQVDNDSQIGAPESVALRREPETPDRGDPSARGITVPGADSRRQLPQSARKPVRK